MGPWYRLVLAVLATWRVTHLLHVEDGPWKIVATMRAVLRRNKMLRQLFDCFYCLSIWVATPIAFLVGKSSLETLLLVPALSAGAILIDRFAKDPMPPYVEDPPTPDDNAGEPV
jgi:hypothetical protein